MSRRYEGREEVHNLLLPNATTVVPLDISPLSALGLTTNQIFQQLPADIASKPYEVVLLTSLLDTR